MTVHPHVPNAGEMMVSAVVWHVKCARNHLYAAQSNLDDAGFTCEVLSELYSDASALVADWHGRPVPVDPDTSPLWIAAAASEWRRQNRRSY